MRTVCEVVVQDIFPVLRSAITKELITNYSLNQTEVAKLLDVSQPAVSQYLRQLRGKNVLDNEQVMKEIKEISGLLHSKQITHRDLAARMCSVSKIVLASGLLKDTNFHGIENCAACK